MGTLEDARIKQVSDEVERLKRNVAELEQII